eukprot:3014308-Rhodomonas_salina.3
MTMLQSVSSTRAFVSGWRCDNSDADGECDGVDDDCNRRSGDSYGNIEVCDTLNRDAKGDDTCASEGYDGRDNNCDGEIEDKGVWSKK